MTEYEERKKTERIKGYQSNTGGETYNVEENTEEIQYAPAEQGQPDIIKWTGKKWKPLDVKK